MSPLPQICFCCFPFYEVPSSEIRDAYSFAVYKELNAKLQSITELTNRLVLFPGQQELCPFEGYADGENSSTVEQFEPLQFNVCFQSLSGTPPTILGVIPEAGNDSRTSGTSLRSYGHTRTLGTFQTSVTNKTDYLLRYTIGSC